MERPWSEGVAVVRTAKPKVARERALVLHAVGIPCALFERDGEHVVAVPESFAQRAGRELALYEAENRGWRRPEELPLALTESWAAVAAWLAVLLVVYWFARDRVFAADWRNAGACAASNVREGEWWRCVTAITLHADGVHLLGNLVFGALFVALACEMLGTGPGLGAVLLSGALANLANAWVQAPDFRSVGASTAVFGALGLLGGHRWQRRKLVRGLRNANWIPLLASAFLLAYLGSGGTRTEGAVRVDVLGHALGFITGGALGALHGRFAHAWRPGARAQVAFGVATFALIAGCWWSALR